jgi:tRNA (uracil-5-)-methyltransferase
MAEVGSSSSSSGVVVETKAETVTSSSTASEHAAAALNSTTAGHEVLETWTLVVDQFSKYASQKQFEKFLTDLDVGHHKAVKVPNRDMAFAVFRDRAKFDAAMVTIGAASFKGKPVSVFEKTGSAKFERKKRDRDDDQDADGDGQKRQRDDKNSHGGNSNSSSSRVKKSGKEATSPWHDVEYEDQLARKEKIMRQEALLPLLRGIKKTYTKPRDGSMRKTPAYLAGMLDETWAGVNIESIVKSPQKVGYRNKCEFTFGNDSAGARSLGFRISSFDEGVMVDPPHDAPTVPAAMRSVVDAMIQFVRGSALAPYDLKTHKGVWRLCTIRYSRRTRDLHVLLCVKLADVDADVWAGEVARLATALEPLRRDAATDAGDDADDAMYGVGVDGLGTQLVTGCGYQAYDGASVAPTDLAVHSAFGRASVRETLLGAEFEIAPTAFFQVSPLCSFFPAFLHFHCPRPNGHPASFSFLPRLRTPT